MVNCTMISGTAPGRIWRNKILASEAPRFLAAWTNTEFFRANVRPRTRRAKVGVENTATAITTFPMPLPKIATIAIARMMPGKAKRVSQIRMMIESTIPR